MTGFAITEKEKPKWHELRWNLSNALVGLARRIYPRNPEVNAFLMQVMIDQMIYGQSVVRVNPAEMHSDHSCADKLHEELEITDNLLAERDRVLLAIPECQVHGQGCVPHALEWIERAKAALAYNAELCGARRASEPTPGYPAPERNKAMDFADTINALDKHMGGTFWRVKGLVSFPDLTGFSKQETDMELLPIEFVKQRGDADYGFTGEIYFPTTYPNGDGGVMHLHVEFHG